MKFSHSFARKCQVHLGKYEKRSKLANHSGMGICKHISKKKFEVSHSFGRRCQFLLFMSGPFRENDGQ